MSEVELSPSMKRMLSRSEKTLELSKLQIQYDLDQVVAQVLCSTLMKKSKTKIEFTSAMGDWYIKVDDKTIDRNDYPELIQLDEFLQLYAGAFRVYPNNKVLEGI